MFVCCVFFFLFLNWIIIQENRLLMFLNSLSQAKKRQRERLRVFDEKKAINFKSLSTTTRKRAFWSLRIFAAAEAAAFSCAKMELDFSVIFSVYELVPNGHVNYIRKMSNFAITTKGFIYEEISGSANLRK